MILKKTFLFTLSIILTIPFTQTISIEKTYAETTSTVKNTFRIQGTDRFKTSRAIADEINGTTLENVVLTSGYDFPDGLSGSTLAKKLNAPLLMAGSLSDSKEALDYISAHLNKDGTVYILGGIGVVSKATEDDLLQNGYNVVRISGQNRFETNNSIVENLKPTEGTPVFISNAYGFADALSASAIAAIKGYPLLLSNTDKLPDLIQKQLMNIKPSKIYIIGGTGVITSLTESEIRNAAPSAEIIRLAGSDRYETSMNVYKYFNLTTNNIILASGKDYPDALSGSQLAAKLNASMVLSDENNLNIQQDEFNKNNINNFYILGGSGALSSNVEQAIKFDKEKEIENIKALYATAAQAVRLKDINQYMSTIYANSPAYSSSKTLYEEVFKFLNENDLDIIPTFDSFDFTSINYREAVVKVAETDALTDNYEKTTEYEKVTSISVLKKTDGQWKFYSSTVSGQ